MALTAKGGRGAAGGVRRPAGLLRRHGAGVRHARRGGGGVGGRGATGRTPGVRGGRDGRTRRRALRGGAAAGPGRRPAGGGRQADLSVVPAVPRRATTTPHARGTAPG